MKTRNLKTLLALLLSLMMLCSVLSFTALAEDDEPLLIATGDGETAGEDESAVEIAFSDVAETAWYYDYVTSLAKAGIINGFGDGTFRPEENLTWAQGLKLLLCAHEDLAYVVGNDASVMEVSITDADRAYAVGDDWEDVTMGKAIELGLCDEAQDGAAEISRLDFCKLAAKLFEVTGTAEAFPDCDDPDVLALVDIGVINGFPDGTFRPDETLTRAQISKILWLLIK